MYRILCFLLLSFEMLSQVSLNEYSASNLRLYYDNYLEEEDYIELHNASDQAADISGWYLSDKTDKPKKWAFPSGTVMEPGAFLVVWASGRNEAADGYLHTNFKFKQTAGDEYIILVDRNGNVIESLPLNVTALHHSACKTMDGGSTWGICTTLSPGASNRASAVFTGYAPVSKIVTQRGRYKDSVVVKSTLFPDYDVRYTLDGEIPDPFSPLMPDSLTIKKTSVLTVRAFGRDTTILPGLVDFATYFINEPAGTLPVFSVSGGYESTALAEGDRTLNPIASLEYFDKDGIYITSSYGELDSHGQDSWVNPQRSLDWISRDEMGLSSAIGDKLFHSSDRNEYQRIIFRASGDDNYPAVNDPEHDGSAHIRDEYVQTLVQKGGMQLDVRSVERCLLYLNGKYWGVYSIREKPDDHDYTNHRYNQDKYDIQFLKTWGQSWAEYGGNKAIRDWENFRDSILTSDLSKPEVYAWIKEKLDVVSLMDYMIANLTVVSSDWLNYNTGWWRGLKPNGGHKKWGYIMWDNDATFDYYINYSGVPNTSTSAQACDIEDISDYMDEFFPVDTTTEIIEADSFFWNGEWIHWGPDTFDLYPDLGKHEKIFLKLLNENGEFRNTYFARYADMLSTAFSCETMLKTLDSLVAIISPEMPRHIARWGGSLNEWKANVKDIRNFVAKRCTKTAEGLVDCYDLEGPFKVTLMTDPPGMGDIVFNTLNHTALPWTGSYFGNMDNIISVVPAQGAVFTHWYSKKGSSEFASLNLPKSTVSITAADTLLAVFLGSTGTRDTEQISMAVTPNPGVSEMSVTTGTDMTDGILTVADNTGKLVHSKSGLKGRHSVSELQHLQPGVYIVTLTDRGRTGRTKWVKI